MPNTLGVWSISGTTATLKDKANNSTVLAKITGLKDGVDVDALDTATQDPNTTAGSEANGTIKLTADMLSGTRVVLSSSKYDLDIDTTNADTTKKVVEPAISSATWTTTATTSSTTANYTATLSEGYTLAANKKSLTYSPETAGVVLATVKGLSKDLTTKDGNVVLSADTTKVVLTADEGSDLTNQTDNTITVKFTALGTTKATVTTKYGYQFKFNASGETDSEGNSVTCTAATADVDGGKYGFEAVDAYWDVVGTTATYKEGTKVGYTLALDGKSITYGKPVTATLATLKGLSTDIAAASGVATVTGITVGTDKLTLNKSVLGTTTVTLTNGKDKAGAAKTYALELADDVPGTGTAGADFTAGDAGNTNTGGGQKPKDQNLWSVSGTTATLKATTPAYYRVDGNYVRYTKPTVTSTQATIRNLKAGLVVTEEGTGIALPTASTVAVITATDASPATTDPVAAAVQGVITINDGGVFDKKKVTLVANSSAKGYDYIFDNSSSGLGTPPAISNENWSVSSTTATLKGHTTAGYTMAVDCKSIGYTAESDITLATVTGLKSGLKAQGLKVGVETNGVVSDGLSVTSGSKVINVTGDALGTSKLVVKGTGYTFALDSDVPSTDDQLPKTDTSSNNLPEAKDIWALSGTIATYKNVVPAYYTVNDATSPTEITYHKQEDKATLATVTGLKSGLVVGTGEDSNSAPVSAVGTKDATTGDFTQGLWLDEAGKFGISANVLGTTTVKVKSETGAGTTKYKFVKDATTPPGEPTDDASTFKWSYSNGTATLTGKTNAGFTLKEGTNPDDTLEYSAAKNNTTIATITGLKSGLTVATDGKSVGSNVAGTYVPGLKITSDYDPDNDTAGIITLSGNVLEAPTSKDAKSKAVEITSPKDNYKLATDNTVSGHNGSLGSSDTISPKWFIRTAGSGEATYETTIPGYYMLDATNNKYLDYVGVQTTSTHMKLTGLDGSVTEEILNTDGNATVNTDDKEVTLAEAVLKKGTNITSSFTVKFGGSGDNKAKAAEPNGIKLLYTTENEKGVAKLYQNFTEGYNIKSTTEGTGASAVTTHTISYAPEGYGDPIATVTGLKPVADEIEGTTAENKTGAGTDQDPYVYTTELTLTDGTNNLLKVEKTGTKITLYKGALTEEPVTNTTGSGGYILAVDAAAVGGGSGFGWVIPSGTKDIALYSGTKASWALDTNDSSKKTVKYTAANFSTKLATIKGLSEDVTVSAGEGGYLLNGEFTNGFDTSAFDNDSSATSGEIVIKKGMFGTADKVEIANETGKTFTIASGAVSNPTGKWTSSTKGSVTYKEVTPEGYNDQTGEGKVLERVEGGTLTTTISGLSNKLQTYHTKDFIGIKDGSAKTSYSYTDTNGDPQTKTLDGYAQGIIVGEATNTNGDKVFTLNDKRVLSGKNVTIAVTKTDAAGKAVTTGLPEYTLALSNALAHSIESVTPYPPVWNKTVTENKATYTQTYSPGYKLSEDSKTLAYSAQATTTTLATLTGLKKEIAAVNGTIEGIGVEDVTTDENGAIVKGTIKLDKDVLTNTDVKLDAAGGKNYNLALNEQSLYYNATAKGIGLEEYKDNKTYWDVSNGTAKLMTGGAKEGWKAAAATDNLTITYTKAATSATATLTGLNKNVTADEYGNVEGLDVTPASGTGKGTITVGAEVLDGVTSFTIDKAVGFTKYDIKFDDTNLTEAIAETPYWTVSNGKATYQFDTPAGWTFDTSSGKASLVKEATTMFATIDGLNPNVKAEDDGSIAGIEVTEPTKNGTTDVAGQFTISDKSILNEKAVKLTLGKDETGTTPNYVLDVAADLNPQPFNEPKWYVNKTTATFKQGMTAGYTKGTDNKSITYAAETESKAAGALFLTLTGFKEGVTAEDFTNDVTIDDSGLISLPEKFLGTTNIVATKGTATGAPSYAFDASDLPVPTEADPVWTAGNAAGTFTFSQDTSAGFTGGGSTTLEYNAPKNTVLATISGLNPDLYIKDNKIMFEDAAYQPHEVVTASIDDKKVVISPDALNAKAVNLTAGTYTLDLDPDVAQDKTPKNTPEWVTDDTVANFKTYTPAYYAITADGTKKGKEITYTAAKDGTVYLKLDGIQSNVDINDRFDTTTKVINLDLNQLDDKGVKLTVVDKTSTDYAGVKLAIDSTTDGVAAEITRAEDLKWTVTNGTAKVTSTLTKGYQLSADGQTITFVDAEKADQALITVKGVKASLSASNFDADKQEISFPTSKLDSSVQITNSTGYELGYKFANDYSNSAIVGSVGKDAITVAGTGLTVTGGKGDDTITFIGGRGLPGEGNTFIYATGDGNDVISGFGTTDSISAAGAMPTAKVSGSDAVITLKNGNNEGTITLTGGSGLGKVIVNGAEVPIPGSSDLLLDDNYSMDAAALSDIVAPANASFTPYDFNAGFDFGKKESFAPAISYTGNKK